MQNKIFFFRDFAHAHRPGPSRNAYILSPSLPAHIRALTPKLVADTDLLPISRESGQICCSLPVPWPDNRWGPHPHPTHTHTAPATGRLCCTCYTCVTPVLHLCSACPLYKSDAADDPLRVDVGGPRYTKKKKYLTSHRPTISTLTSYSLSVHSHENERHPTTI